VDGVKLTGMPAVVEHPAPVRTTALFDLAIPTVIESIALVVDFDSFALDSPD